MQRMNTQLITTLALYKPRASTDIQYYNFLREYCILNNCSVEYGVEHTTPAWKKLGESQRKCYQSELCACLPIPVPLNQVYDALRDERSGLIGLTKIETGKTTRYIIKSYNTKIHERNRIRREMERKYLAFFETAADIAIDSGFPAHARVPRKIRKRKPTKLMEDKVKTVSKQHNRKKQIRARPNPPELLSETFTSDSETSDDDDDDDLTPVSQSYTTDFYSFDDLDFGGAGDAISKTRTKKLKKTTTTKAKYTTKKKTQNHPSSDYN